MESSTVDQSVILRPTEADFQGGAAVAFADVAGDFEDAEAAPVLGLVTASAVGQRMADIAESQSGVSESGGEDRGVPHERYVRPFGAGLPPLPWCAFFVSWCYWQATGQGTPWGNPGYVGSVHAWAMSAGRLTTTPQRGDMFGISDRHMGLVAARLRGGQVLTIEGNWGDRVQAVRRDIGAQWYATP